MHNRFDIIIAGAGAAGLSLLWRILNSPELRKENVLVIDKSFEPERNKTWCFWEDLDLPDSDLIYHSWGELLVRIGGKTYSGALDNYQYHCLRGDDFGETIMNRARSNPQVQFLEAGIHDFKSEERHAHAYTSEGVFSGKTVFQSVLKPPGFNELAAEISLTQHFLGLEIECNRELFDPVIATFMDFDVPQKNGVTFMYLLPFSEKRALVEYTIFSKDVLDNEEYKTEISNYLVSRYSLKKNEYSVIREESGAIPMDGSRYTNSYCDHVWNIGTVMGLPKPSTGYAFSRIQVHSDSIIKTVENGGDLSTIKPASSYRFRVYDLMILYLLQNETENAARAFENLFSKNSFDRVLQFLAEETQLFQELSIFSKMPYRPFLRSIYKMKHRIFKGV